MFQPAHPIQIMAILNLTPDSFSDGGRLDSLDAALQQAERALAAGADILDIGGESTRPGAATIDPELEISRVLPAIRAIHKHFPQAVISIDTRKSSVAKAALEAGARIINDVSGLQYDPAMAETAAQFDATLILMHSQGTPETMQQNPQYPHGVVTEVSAFFERQIERAVQAGVSAEHIVLDPGFGFGKTLQHNLLLLHHLHQFLRFGLPVLIGTSRKSFLTLGNRHIEVDRREALTAASVALGMQQGARWIRVHDMETQIPVIRFIEASLSCQSSSNEFPSLYVSQSSADV
jgi:dihydropteroate synthase